MSIVVYSPENAIKWLISIIHGNAGNKMIYFEMFGNWKHLVASNGI